VPESLLNILKLVFLALLWLFFVRVLRAVWAEVKEPVAAASPLATAGAAAPGRGRAATAAKGKSKEPVLKVVEPSDAAGRTFPVHDEMTVGRGGGCGVALPDDRMVSQLHARIFRGPTGDLFVEDLGSTNGTLLNRSKVSGPAKMKRGDRLQVGHTVLELQA
jgi:pSer/pThr/pTyr-binding forkhead associated (FHA) protein